MANLRARQSKQPPRPTSALAVWRGQPVSMAVTGLVLGVVMLAVWPAAFLSVVIAYSLSGLGG